jgi:hypothetical protein
MVALLRAVGAGSLHPSPARSYQQTVVNFATSACTGSGIYTLGHANNKWEIDFFDLNMKKSSTVFVMDKFPAQGWMGGLPVSPDGRYLLFAQTDGVSSDLIRADNWQ